MNPSTSWEGTLNACCFCVCNRPQPSATVRNRSTTAAGTLYGQAYMESAAEVLVTFGGFKRRVCVAGVALCDIPTCFISCQKSFCVTGASASFSDDDFLIFVCGRCSTLEVSMFSLCGRRSTLDVSCCVLNCFRESYAQGCVKWWRCA